MKVQVFLALFGYFVFLLKEGWERKRAVVSSKEMSCWPAGSVLGVSSICRYLNSIDHNTIKEITLALVCRFEERRQDYLVDLKNPCKQPPGTRRGLWRLTRTAAVATDMLLPEAGCQAR